jgi:hypothetical protein
MPFIKLRSRPVAALNTRTALATFGTVLTLLVGHGLVVQIEKRAAEDRMTFGTSADPCIRAACLHSLHVPAVTDNQ